MSEREFEKTFPKWIGESDPEKIKPILVQSKDIIAAHALLQDQGVLCEEVLETMAAYAPNFYDTVNNTVKISAEYVAYGPGEFDTEEEEEKAIDKVIEEMSKVIMVALAPVYCANDSIWPFLDDEALEECYYNANIEYSEKFGTLWKDLMDIIRRCAGKDYKESFKARIQSTGLHPVQITEIALIVIAYLKTVPYYPFFEDGANK